MRTSLLLVDQNRLHRQGLRALFEAGREFDVIGEAQDSREATQITITHAPDLILIDSQSPDDRDIDIIAQIKRRMAYVRIVVLTDVLTDARAHELISAGVNRCVPKVASFEELLNALRSVAAGLAVDVSESGAEAHPRLAASAGAPNDRLSRLTTRERSILQLITEGCTNRAAAGCLGVSQKTVEKHRANLMRKLGVHNATELMSAAVGMGLAQPPALRMPRAGPDHFERPQADDIRRPPCGLQAARPSPGARSARAQPPEGVKETWGNPAFPCESSSAAR